MDSQVKNVREIPGVIVSPVYQLILTVPDFYKFNTFLEIVQKKEGLFIDSDVLEYEEFASYKKFKPREKYKTSILKVKAPDNLQEAAIAKSVLEQNSLFCGGLHGLVLLWSCCRKVLIKNVYYLAAGYEMNEGSLPCLKKTFPTNGEIFGICEEFFENDTYVVGFKKI